MGKSGKQTKASSKEQEQQNQEESSPYDGLVGDFVEDYPVLCERSGLTALEVQVNAARPGRFINLVLKDETDPSTLSEIQLAQTPLPESHIEPCKMALEMVPSALDHIKLLHMALTPALLQGVATIAGKKNLRHLSLDGCLLPEDLNVLLSVPITHLSLRCCSLSDDHCTSLGHALMDNTHLVSLNLACNRIGDGGMKQLVKGLRVNRALLLLSLTQNYISDIGTGLLAEALSNQLTLTHEETVHRRRLLVSAGGWPGEDGMVDLDASAAGLTPRSSLTMQQQASPDKHARGSKLDRGSAKQGGKKDSAKKDDKGGKKEDKSRRSEHHHGTQGSVDTKKNNKGKDSKAGKKPVSEPPPGTPPPELPKIVSPLLEHVTEEKGVLKMSGNMALASVSLAYNHLTDSGVRLLMEAMKKQVSETERGQGLLRLSVKNSMVSAECLAELEQLVAARNPLQQKQRQESVISEEPLNGTAVQQT